MTARSKTSARRETVALTREDVEQILIHHMGWEHEDADAFWNVASRLKAGKA